MPDRTCSRCDNPLTSAQQEFEGLHLECWAQREHERRLMRDDAARERAKEELRDRLYCAAVGGYIAASGGTWSAAQVREAAHAFVDEEMQARAEARGDGQKES